MDSSAPDDPTLMAYADGQLDEQQARSVQAAAGRDPRIAQRIEQFRRSAALAREALTGELQAPVPPALLEAVRSAAAAARPEPQVQAAAAPRPAPPGVSARVPARWWRLAAGSPSFALAACLGASSFGLIGLMLGLQSARELAIDGGAGIALSLPAHAARTLHDALDTLPSAERRTLSPTPGHELEMIASFRDRAGVLCREFAVRSANDAVAAVACRERRDWRLRFALRTPAAPGYAPASAAAALDAYLETIEAGAPLGEAEERAALTRTK